MTMEATEVSGPAGLKEGKRWWIVDKGGETETDKGERSKYRIPSGNVSEGFCEQRQLKEANQNTSDQSTGSLEARWDLFTASVMLCSLSFNSMCTVVLF